MEVLDKCFENVCELDLIFHVDKVHYILDEIVMGGMVLETNIGAWAQRRERAVGAARPMPSVDEAGIVTHAYTPGPCPSVVPLSICRRGDGGGHRDEPAGCVRRLWPPTPARGVSAKRARWFT